MRQAPRNSDTPRRTGEAGAARVHELERIAWIRAQQTTLWRYLRLLGARLDEVEDLMQDAFVALFCRYPNESHPAQVRLLRTIARNRFLEVRRRHRPEQAAWSGTLDNWLAESPQGLDDDYSEQVAACLHELAPRARTGMTLHHVDGQSIGHVAKHLGLHRSGALTLLQRSRDLLRTCLARRGIAPVRKPPSANAKQPSTRVSS